MGKEDYIRSIIGEVIETLPNTTFKVKITDEKYPVKNHIVMAKISGKMRLANIRVLPGDRVDVDINIYDTAKGKIVYRHK